MPGRDIPASFGRPAEPESELEDPPAAMMPGVALITVVPVLDEARLAAVKEQLRTAVFEAFVEGLREAMDLELADGDAPAPKSA